MQACQVCIRFHHIFKTTCNHESKTLTHSGFTVIKSPVHISKLGGLLLQQNRLKALLPTGTSH